jgi:hypothetical protein
MRTTKVRPWTMCLLLFVLLTNVRAQQSIGTVGVQDATVSGSLEVTNGRTVLTGSSSITAKDHTAEVTLSRGGEVRVCATSGLHVTVGKSGGVKQPLMLALDRGAVEVTMPATSKDMVMTPDLRLAMRGDGPLDLHLRVTSNGDTCVENRGDGAPTLNVSDQFGEATYELRAGQHVLFEHGSLKEVVDHETSPCGCPPASVVSVADVGTTSANPAAPGDVVAAKQTAEQHPFPAAVSQGLAPAPPVPQASPGVVHAQVTTTLAYGAGATPEPSGGSAGSTDAPAAGGKAMASTSGTASGTSSNADAPQAAANQASGTVRAEAPPPPPAPSSKDLGHLIGRFFKRLFGRG